MTLRPNAHGLNVVQIAAAQTYLPRCIPDKSSGHSIPVVQLVQRHPDFPVCLQPQGYQVDQANPGCLFFLRRADLR